jgi:hypothetical protein
MLKDVLGQQLQPGHEACAEASNVGTEANDDMTLRTPFSHHLAGSIDN